MTDGWVSEDGSDEEAVNLRRRVNLVAHTHWDREWYAPFRSFQLRLVELVDKLLDLMESDSSYGFFLFDGQMGAIDDYLEVRPGNEGRLRALGAAGRISFGPWYILMDEFLVSGETIVRNLQLGLERAAAFGGAMEIGYLPDMFGHVAQMPQILRAAGFEHAVVWRGVPSAIDRTAFWWMAPDGSSVRAEYLVDGYSLGASVGEDPQALVRRLDAFVEEYGKFLPAGDDPILFPNGTDHEEPQPWLGRVVAEANASQDRFEIRLTSLPEALGSSPHDGLPTWTGELRSGARANVLMGVASNRVDVKQAAARAERALERTAEPLAALLLEAERYPTAALALAWRQLILNSAHDSVCACSHDEVGSAVLQRYAEATRLAEGVTEKVLANLAASLSQPGHVAVNPSPRARSGLVELVLDGSAPLEGIQVLEEKVGLAAELVLTTGEVRGVLGQLGDRDQMGEGAYISGVDVSEDETGIAVSVTVLPERSGELNVSEIKSDLLARFSLRPDAQVKVKLDQAASRRVLARIADVPAYGWKRWDPSAVPDPVTASFGDDGCLKLGNSLVSVEISPVDGSFSLNGLPGFNRLIDGGDYGDTYNYSPPEHDIVVEAPERVVLSLVESGPLRALALVERRCRWPERIEEEKRARAGEREVAVLSRIEVRAAERLVRITTEFDNTCRDHRLRAWFPLPEPAETSRAECAFGTVDRGLVAEGGPSERPLPTYPSRRFVEAGGLSVFHEGLCEYELVDLESGPQNGLQAHGLCLTLLRATGMLSRLTMLNRPLPAGPVQRVEGPQLKGPHALRYAVALGVSDPYELADEAFSDLAVVSTLGGGHLGPKASLLEVRGAEVSSLRRNAGAVELRVFNPGDELTIVELKGRNEGNGDGPPLAGQLVDLKGRIVRSFEGTFPLRPREIATARLTGI